MHLEDLYTFKIVAQEGSISKAAKTLHFVQSNVTAKIKRLEKAYETPLFFRHPRGVTLTPHGRTLLVYAEQILQLVEDSKTEIMYTNEPSGTLRIGSMETTAAVRLPLILSSYVKQYPKVNLSLQTNHTNALIKQVVNDELEGAFIAGHPQHPALSAIKVVEEELICIANKTIDWDDLKNETIIVFKSGCFYRNVLESWLLKRGIVPTRKMELNTLEGIVGCVRSGLGIAMLTKSVMDQLDKKHELTRYLLPSDIGTIPTSFIYKTEGIKTAAFRTFLQELQR
ncbi:LysR family transcriptional regulator [Massilibacterium senegalense]|uniref:LysR family transcriptional regulator n=1 Tax=Massilibacterium senegalense TaxID=1632858 RepID=UPI00078502D6|nr:LysR family transcriptional regulator [Massilibacterium senegalense]